MDDFLFNGCLTRDVVVAVPPEVGLAPYLLIPDAGRLVREATGLEGAAGLTSDCGGCNDEVETRLVSLEVVATDPLAGIVGVGIDTSARGGGCCGAAP